MGGLWTPPRGSGGAGGSALTLPPPFRRRRNECPTFRFADPKTFNDLALKSPDRGALRHPWCMFTPSPCSTGHQPPPPLSLAAGGRKGRRRERALARGGRRVTAGSSQGRVGARPGSANPGADTAASRPDTPARPGATSVARQPPRVARRRYCLSSRPPWVARGGPLQEGAQNDFRPRRDAWRGFRVSGVRRFAPNKKPGTWPGSASGEECLEARSIRYSAASASIVSTDT